MDAWNISKTGFIYFTSYFYNTMNEQNGIPFLIHQDYITPLNRPVTSITGKIITIDDFPPKSNPKSLRSIQRCSMSTWTSS